MRYVCRYNLKQRMFRKQQQYLWFIEAIHHLRIHLSSTFQFFPGWKTCETSVIMNLAQLH